MLRPTRRRQSSFVGTNNNNNNNYQLNPDQRSRDPAEYFTLPEHPSVRCQNFSEMDGSSSIWSLKSPPPPPLPPPPPPAVYKPDAAGWGGVQRSRGERRGGKGLSSSRIGVFSAESEDEGVRAGPRSVPGSDRVCGPLSVPGGSAAQPGPRPAAGVSVPPNPTELSDNHSTLFLL